VGEETTFSSVFPMASGHFAISLGTDEFSDISSYFSSRKIGNFSKKFEQTQTKRKQFMQSKPALYFEMRFYWIKVTMVCVFPTVIGSL